MGLVGFEIEEEGGIAKLENFEDFQDVDGIEILGLRKMSPGGKQFGTEKLRIRKVCSGADDEGEAQKHGIRKASLQNRNSSLERSR